MMINGILIGGKKKRKKTTLKKKRKKKASSTDDFGFLNQSALSLDALMNNFDQDELSTPSMDSSSYSPGVAPSADIVQDNDPELWNPTESTPFPHPAGVKKPYQKLAAVEIMRLQCLRNLQQRLTKLGTKAEVDIPKDTFQRWYFSCKLVEELSGSDGSQHLPRHNGTKQKKLRIPHDALLPRFNILLTEEDEVEKKEEDDHRNKIRKKKDDRHDNVKDLAVNGILDVLVEAKMERVAAHALLKEMNKFSLKLGKSLHNFKAQQKQEAGDEDSDEGSGSSFLYAGMSASQKKKKKRVVAEHQESRNKNGDLVSQMVLKFGKSTMKINVRHYNKLYQMFHLERKRRQLSFSSNIPKAKTQAGKGGDASTHGDGSSKDSNNDSGSDRSDEEAGGEEGEEEDTAVLRPARGEARFHRAVFALLVRYSALTGQYTEGAGMQAALPSEVFDCLLENFDCRMECFASPLNSRYRRFCSAYGDTDGVFGSVGSFFSFFPTEGCFEANPPFTPEVMAAMCAHMHNLLSSTEKALCFIVIVPAWKHTQGWQQLKESQFLRKYHEIDQNKHGYCEGAQHMRASRYRISTCDTSIFFMQNRAALDKWPVSKAVLKKLEAAFQSKHSSERQAKRIFVGGVPSGVTEAMIEQHFQQFGSVTDVYFPKRGGAGAGASRGFCFVKFSKIKEAKRAVAESPLSILGKFAVKEITGNKTKEETAAAASSSASAPASASARAVATAAVSKKATESKNKGKKKRKTSLTHQKEEITGRTNDSSGDDDEEDAWLFTGGKTEGSDDEDSNYNDRNIDHRSKKDKDKNMNKNKNENKNKRSKMKPKKSNQGGKKKTKRKPNQGVTVSGKQTFKKRQRTL